MDSANTASLQFTNYAASADDEFFDSLQYFNPVETTETATALQLTNQSTTTTTIAETTTIPAIAQRGSKKRTRASRRAPTTVLTTDTANFRAMVQEFTGIPCPPFGPGPSTSPSPFNSSRFELLGSNGGSAINFVSSVRNSPPFLLRPYAQKAQKCSPSSGANIGTSNSLVTNANINDIVKLSSSVMNTNETNYHQPSFANLQSPLVPYQSLVESQLNQKYSVSDMAIQLCASSDGLGMQSGMKGTSVVPSSWATTGHGNKEQEQLRSPPVMFNNNSQQRGSFCKLMFGVNSSASGFNGEKEVAETSVAATMRGEGMVDSWICSSD